MNRTPTGRARTTGAQPLVALATGLLLATGLAACQGAPSRPSSEDSGTPGAVSSGDPGESVRREVLVDRGTADVVDLRSVVVQARPGDVVVLRSGNPGRGRDDESPVHHLFTSAPADAPPPLFVTAGSGHLPNPGAWGLCRGGDAAAATTNCPVPPLEGLDAYDGKSYFSHGGLLPGETRELPLAENLPLGTYQFACAIHPGMHVDIEVVDEPVAADAASPLDTQTAFAGLEMLGPSPAGDAVVVLGPTPRGVEAEVLTALPDTVHIPAGGRVTWRVGGRSPHTVELGINHPPHLADTTAEDTTPVVPAGRRWDGTGVVRSGVLSTDPSVRRTSFSVVFTEPGIYRAFDRFHAGISTLIRVG